MRYLWLLLMASFVAIFPHHTAQADDDELLLALPEGHVVLHISATERQDVAQDLLIATLNYEATHRSSKDLQNDINTVMAKAVARAKEDESVKTRTGAYNVYQFTEPRTKEQKWRGQQRLSLESKDSETLLTLAGDLQELGLTMNGLSYMLDPKLAVSTQDGLMEAALKQLQARADLAAKALGKSTAELRDVRVQSAGTPVPRIHKQRTMMLESASASMAPPVAEGGETTISMTVSARALLKP